MITKTQHWQRFFCFLPLLFLVSFIHLTGQEKFYAIKGVVIDSITKEPISYLAVFVPNTTIATLTNERGEFSIAKLPLSTVELAFSHLNYGLKRVWIANALIKGTSLTILMKRKAFDIKEVEIAAKRNRRAEADRKYFLGIFYKFFLGDIKNSECKLINPEVIRFRKAGSRIIASARSPLLITNNRLGYKLTYHLDFFVFNDSEDYNRTSKNMCFYSFQGVSLYEGLKAEDTVTYEKWAHNRNEDFSGSLGHFLACLYSDQLSSNGYKVIKAGVPGTLINKKIKEPALVIDSVFFFDAQRNQSLYLYYLPMNPYPINEKTGMLGKPDCMSLKCSDTLLVFKEKRDLLIFYDDEITLFYIGKGDLEFYPSGDYQIFNGDLLWASLEAKKKIIKILPLDYQPSNQN
ncbi:MAG: carboxypeptidase-like regulatory domain-containing protein [Bacteroidia bacterium]|nr:carboxypeptidase-like regulatory domain-containing protein [Bacteroidia bacterium]